MNQQMRWDAGIAASRDLVAKGAIGRATAAQVRVAGQGGGNSGPGWPRPLASTSCITPSTTWTRYGRCWANRVDHQHPREVPEAGARPGRDPDEHRPRVPDGLQALITMNNFDEHGRRRDLPVRGHRGGPRRHRRLRVATLPSRSARYAGAAPLRRQPISYEFDTRWFPDAFLGPMSRPHGCDATGRDPQTSGRDNLRTLALVFGAYRSAAERRSIQVRDVLSE